MGSVGWLQALAWNWPLLAVIAACFPDTSTHQCLLVWLITSTTPESAEEERAEVGSPAEDQTVASLLADPSVTQVCTFFSNL